MALFCDLNLSLDYYILSFCYENESIVPVLNVIKYCDWKLCLLYVYALNYPSYMYLSRFEGIIIADDYNTSHHMIISDCEAFNSSSGLL